MNGIDWVGEMDSEAQRKTSVWIDVTKVMQMRIESDEEGKEVEQDEDGKACFSKATQKDSAVSANKPAQPMGEVNQ